MIIEKETSIARVARGSNSMILPKWWCELNGVQPKSKIKILVSNDIIIIPSQNKFDSIKSQLEKLFNEQ